jgi:hypothetical protein
MFTLMVEHLLNNPNALDKSPAPHTQTQRKEGERFGLGKIH